MNKCKSIIYCTYQWKQKTWAYAETATTFIRQATIKIAIIVYLSRSSWFIFPAADVPEAHVGQVLELFRHCYAEVRESTLDVQYDAARPLFQVGRLPPTHDDSHAYDEVDLLKLATEVTFCTAPLPLLCLGLSPIKERTIEQQQTSSGRRTRRDRIIYTPDTKGVGVLNLGTHTISFLGEQSPSTPCKV